MAGQHFSAPGACATKAVVVFILSEAALVQLAYRGKLRLGRRSRVGPRTRLGIRGRFNGFPKRHWERGPMC